MCAYVFTIEWQAMTRQWTAARTGPPEDEDDLVGEERRHVREHLLCMHACV